MILLNHVNDFAFQMLQRTVSIVQVPYVHSSSPFISSLQTFYLSISISLYAPAQYFILLPFCSLVLIYSILLFYRLLFSCSVGLVEFSSPVEAQRAMIELNDTEFMGRQVFIREDREEGGGGGGGGGGGDRGGRSMSNPMLQNRNQHHQQHHTHHTQGQYHHPHSMSMPLQMQPHPSYDRPERPPRATQTVAPGEGRKIYVGNLSWDVCTAHCTSVQYCAL